MVLVLWSPESPGILYEQCTVFQYSLDAWPGMAELEEWKLGDGIPTVGKAGERHRQKLMALKKSINASKPYQVRLGAAWCGLGWGGLPFFLFKATKTWGS